MKPKLKIEPQGHNVEKLQVEGDVGCGGYAKERSTYNCYYKMLFALDTQRL